MGSGKVEVVSQKSRRRGVGDGRGTKLQEYKSETLASCHTSANLRILAGCHKSTNVKLLAGCNKWFSTSGAEQTSNNKTDKQNDFLSQQIYKQK